MLWLFSRGDDEGALWSRRLASRGGAEEHALSPNPAGPESEPEPVAVPSCGRPLETKAARPQQRTIEERSLTAMPGFQTRSGGCRERLMSYARLSIYLASHKHTSIDHGPKSGYHGSFESFY